MSDQQKVILLEDDPSMLAALSEVLKREKIEVFATSSPDEVKSYLAQNRVLTVFVDCLLPTENGVDFVKSLRQQYPRELLDIVLMSGVFTDPTFIRESLRESNATSFLKKPFTNEEFLECIQRPVSQAQEAPHPRKALYQLFDRPKATAREKRKAIEALEDIHGFDLALIYCILVESQLSGHLNIVAENGDVSGISFSSGSIVAVDIADKETYLGKLLIDSGYLLPDDLEGVLGLKSPKKIGERLIQYNLLSPHGFDEVMSYQMSLRLTRTIVDAPVKVNFVPTEVEMTNPCVNIDLFQAFLHDWIASRITANWIKAHLVSWGHAQIVKSPLFEEKKSALDMPLVKNLAGIVEKSTSGLSLTELVESKAFPHDPMLKSLHFLFTRGVLCFKEKASSQPKDSLLFLRQMFQQFQNRSQYEILGIMARMTNLPENQPDQIYKDFKTLLGALPKDASKDVSSLHAQLLQIAKSAFEYSKTHDQDKAREEVLRGDVAVKLKASSLFEDAKNHLQKSQFKEALAKMEQVASLDPKISKLQLYRAWAKLGAIDPSKNKVQVLKDVDLDLMQVDPEDKFDALYHFVMGVYHRVKGDPVSARKSLEKSIAMDNSMIFARRELTVLTSAVQKKEPDVFSGDLKTLVGNLFSKKR